MKYQHGTRRKAVEYEKALVEYWKKNRTFEKSIEQRSVDDAYVFYDGPPFITGNPHHGTLLSSIVKDAIPRYQTMRGKRVERVWGWDCHGLPAENFVEKQLGILDRRQIGATETIKTADEKELSPVSLEEYITKARESMVANSATWEDTIDRIGRWVDFKGAYKTMDKDFMESVWWAFKELYDKGLIYEGKKVLMYDTKFATPVSKNEVTMDNDAYQTVTDPSVFVKFRVKDNSKSVTVVRHAETNYNEQGLVNYDPSVDVFLTEKGKKQAEELAKKLKDRALDLIIVSDLNRTRETAKIINKFHNVEIISDSLLNDIRNGFEGESVEEYHRQRDAADDRLNARFNGGESINDVNKRTRQFLADLKKRSEKNILLVTSNNNMKQMKSIVEGSPTENIFEIHIPNTSSFDFELDGDDGEKHLLAWTTTPWTLPANMALAVNPKMEYVEVQITKSKKVFLIAGKHSFAITQGYYGKLKNKLEKQGFEVTIIDHINSADPNRAENLKMLANYDFDNANVITHSLGAATFLSYLEQNDIKVESLTMIAPAYPGRNVGSKNQKWIEESGYVGFDLDYKNILKKIVAQPTIIYSDNDMEGRRKNCEDLGEVLNAKMVLEVGKKHFFGGEGEYFEPDHDYGFTENLILAKDLAEKVLAGKDYTVVREMAGKDLIGIQYFPILTEESSSVISKNAHKVYAADFVENEGGTGIVHIAPAYGEDDYALSGKNDIPVRDVLDDNGFYLPETAGKLREMFEQAYGENYQEILQKAEVKTNENGGYEVWSSNKMIAKMLEKLGIVWKIEMVRHEYPFNPRSKQRIMYRAFPSWFFDIQGQKPLMLEQNENINWFPEHLKHGRFAKNIDQAPDWNLSRDRFWATAMPVWKGDKGTVKVVGSYAELKELSGVELDDYHRPWVDDIEFDLDGEHFKRVDKVLDCWFESGSMPFAQLHYPFENKEKFEQNYPADFIVEYIGQVRAWFYYVHAVNTALFGENAFKNVITTGVVAGNDGRKMSKSLGNFTDPNELMDKFSADSLRFLLLSSPLLSGEDFALLDKDVSDVARKLSMVWNMYDFFTMYAEVDGWDSDGRNSLPKDFKDFKNPLDVWIISRLHQLKADITKNMDNYNIPDAMSGILPFIDDASNWFVRRSRRRFWKSDNDEDKNEAYGTLYIVLTKLAVLLAPFTPFLAEELYQKMTGEESVHLLDWPTSIEVDEKVLADMARARTIIEQGLALRMDREDGFGQIKIRQPLYLLSYGGERLPLFYESIVEEEVNVKHVGWDGDMAQGEVELDKKLTPELRQEGFVRELIRCIQGARKKAGLNVDDRIRLAILDYDFEGLPKGLLELVKAETLAVELTTGNYGYDEVVEIEGERIIVSLEKAE